MKVIDLTPDRAVRPAGLFSQVSGSFNPRKPRSEEAPAQERIIGSLQKSLGNQYVLLRGVKLEGLEMPIPIVLIGPPGVRVLVASSLRGIYRAREDQWEKLDERQQKYRPALPNLLARTMLLARSVHDFLTKRGVSLSEVEPVLYFSDPGIHVETIRPVVRLLMADVVDRFTAGFVQSRILLNQEEIESVVRLLAGTREAAEDGDAPQVELDAFSFSNVEKPRAKSNIEQAISAREQAFMSQLTRLPGTGRQWVVLSIIIFVFILLLTALVLYVLFNS